MNISKTTLTILLSFSQNVEENNTDQKKKTAHQKLAPFLRYSLFLYFLKILGLGLGLGLGFENQPSGPFSMDSPHSN